jgi:hypothetical protein
MSEILTSDWTRINTAADRFEQEWKKGTRPRIEDFLVEVEESRWPALLEDALLHAKQQIRHAEQRTRLANE